MTIDEAIANARKKAKEIRENIIDGDNLEPYESYCITMADKSAEEHKQLAEWLEELKQLRNRTKTGHWIDYSEEGFVECSECGASTNCDGNINELHFCFSCGARMNKGGREE